MGMNGDMRINRLYTKMLTGMGQRALRIVVDAAEKDAQHEDQNCTWLKTN